MRCELLERSCAHARLCLSALQNPCTPAKSCCALQGQFLCKRQKTEQEKEDDGDESETTDEELLSCLEARTREVQATTRQLQAETQQLQAAAHAMRSRQQQRKERRKHQAMMEKWNREILYGGAHASYGSIERFCLHRVHGCIKRSTPADSNFFVRW